MQAEFASKSLLVHTDGKTVCVQPSRWPKTRAEQEACFVAVVTSSMCRCAGDGLADLVGRQIGRRLPLPWNPQKVRGVLLLGQLPASVLPPRHSDPAFTASVQGSAV